MIAENRRLLERRWPDIAAWIDAARPFEEIGLYEDTPAPTLRLDGIQLASAHDPLGEARLQADLVPRAARQATVYGLAQGDLVRVLLQREALQRVRVVLLHPALAAVVLQVFEAKDWLADPRCELVRGDRERELTFPFAASPGCLELADDSCARIRDLVRLELATPRLRRHALACEEEMRLREESNRSFLRTDRDVSALFETAVGRTLHVAAAGPSLADHFEGLAQRAPGNPLIAVDAAWKPLLAAGIEPDIVVTADTSVYGMTALFQVDAAHTIDTTLVYFPITPTEVLAGHRGRRVSARFGRCFEPPRPDSPTQPELFASGSVLHPATDLAVRMGAGEVVFYGADFGFPNGASHVRGSAFYRAEPNSESGVWVLGADDERIPSQPNLVGYLRDLERYIERRPQVRFVNAGTRGARIAGTVTIQEGEADSDAA